MTSFSDIIAVGDNVMADLLKFFPLFQNTNTAVVKALLTPWLPYRLQWDDLMQKCDLIKEFDNGYRLMHHVTKKKFPLSARDSYEGDRIFMAARSIQTAGPTPTSDVVRTYQHLGGYRICSTGENSVDFTMYFQCDLNVKVPSFVQKLIDRAKPKFMCDKVKALRKALTTFKVDPAHIEKM
uniref:START domain-containing protein n=1 Tax=Angiostrongylus cantonensis TaxID=6313 RepID=A0A0K0DLS3_ANGCA